MDPAQHVAGSLRRQHGKLAVEVDGAVEATAGEVHFPHVSQDELARLAGAQLASVGDATPG